MIRCVTASAGLLLVLGCLVPSLTRTQGLSSWGDLKAGLFPVGFKFIYELDRSRSWRAKEDANGYPVANGRSRPIRIGIWYPADAGSTTTRMAYRDYMPSSADQPIFRELNALLVARDTENLRSSFKNEFDDVVAAAMVAVRDASPRQGTFPLVVYSAGLNNNSQDNVVLCEYLASHGFVVITVPQLGWTSADVNLRFQNATDLETQVLDVQYAIGAVREFPNVDPSRLGVVGYSVGGVVALNLAMRSIDVDALVTLDPTFGVAPYITLATDSPFYATTNLRMPWLYMYRREAATSLAVLNSLQFSERYEFELKGMVHQDFSSSPMLTRDGAPASGRTARSARQGYQVVVRYTERFLSAYLENNQASATFVRATREQNGDADTIAKSAVHRGSSPPPTEGRFLQLIEQQGLDYALKIYTEARQGEQGKRPVFSENFLNQLGYRYVNQSRFPEAIKIFGLNVDAYPDSANVYDSLAETYMRSGNTDLAIKNYEKTLALNPNNPGAVAALKKLKAA